MENRAQFFRELVLFERKRQDKKWGSPTDRMLDISLDKWNTILTEEFGEFAKEVNEHNDFKAIIELAETAAVCQCIFECYLSRQDEATVQAAYDYMKHRVETQASKV